MKVILTEQEKLEVCEKFISKVILSEANNMPPENNLCWQYEGSQLSGPKKGAYPFTIYKNHKFFGHKFMLEHFSAAGEKPREDSFVCHICNNSRCINPTHLYWGDAKTNADDRTKNGTQVGGVVYEDEIINQVKLFQGTMSAAVRKFGMHRTTIKKIKQRQIRNQGLQIILPLKPTFSHRNNMARDILKGKRTKDIAIKFNVTPGTVSEFRSKLCRSM